MGSPEKTINMHVVAFWNIRHPTHPSKSTKKKSGVFFQNCNNYTSFTTLEVQALLIKEAYLKKLWMIPMRHFSDCFFFKHRTCEKYLPSLAKWCHLQTSNMAFRIHTIIISTKALAHRKLHHVLHKDRNWAGGFSCLLPISVGCSKLSDKQILFWACRRKTTIWQNRP